MKLIKRLLIFTLVGSVKVSVAQMGVYAEYLIKTEASFLTMPDIITTVNARPGISLQELKVGNKESDYYYADSVGLKVKHNSIGCAADNWENVKAASNEKDLNAYNPTDVKVVKTKEERTILEQVCQKAIITYKVKIGGISSKYIMEVWHTTAKDIPSVTMSYGSIEEISSNELTDALKELGGVILYIETTMSMLTMELKTKMECVKFEVKPITDQMVELDLSKCSRTMNYKEYRKKVLERQRQDNRMNQMNKDMDRMNRTNQMNSIGR